MTGLKVGEVAKQAGVNLQTIHYYERRGLLPKPPQSKHAVAILMGTWIGLLSIGCSSVAHSASHQAGAQDPAEASDSTEHESRFVVLGMSCEGCAQSAIKALRAGVPGLRSVSVDFATKQGRVTSTQPASKAQIQEALGTLGFEARFPGDAPQPLLIPEDVKARLDIKTISRGEAIHIEDHLVLGKYTIFDYFAEWCGPCHLLTPKLERLVQEDDHVALRTVDISNWESAAAKQATKDFKLPGLPYVRVYGPDGAFLGAVHGNHVDKVRGLIREEGQE